MIPEVTRENVHILIPYKVSKICSQIASERQIPLTRAIAVMRSPIFDFLAPRFAKICFSEPASIKADLSTSGGVAIVK